MQINKTSQILKNHTFKSCILKNQVQEAAFYKVLVNL